MTQRLPVLATVFTLSLGSSVTLADSATFPRLGLDRVQLAQHSKEQFIEKLNLTQAQRQQIQQIRQKYQSSISQRQERLELTQRELAQMIAGTDSVAAIRAKHRAVAQLRQAIDNLRFESMLEMRNVLTIEQRQQFARMMQQRRDNWREGIGSNR